MKYRRYGKFRFSDYTSSWFAIILISFLILIGIFTNTKFYLLIVPLMFLGIMVWSIYKPNRECFSISGNTLIIIQGRKKQSIDIPYNPTVILSYADLCPPIAKRIGSGNQTYLLKGRYAVSILQNVSLETVLSRLHKNHVFRYTATMVEECFNEQQYIYSFVCNQELLQKLLANKTCLLIIPESLMKMVSVDLNSKNVYIDKCY